MALGEKGVLSRLFEVAALTVLGAAAITGTAMCLGGGINAVTGDSIIQGAKTGMQVSSMLALPLSPMIGMALTGGP